jgi:riboflavin kinase/FMN adenylyltransferase
VSQFISHLGIADIPQALRRCVLAIGNFDGFHRGHQSVFARLKARADALGVPAVVMSFEPHPRDVFAPEPFMFRLTYPKAKAELAQALGLDGLVILPFSREFSQLSAEEFVSSYLVKGLEVSGVIVGADFLFGHARRGTPDFLREQGLREGFFVETLELLDEGAEAISSSRIRDALALGDLETANRLLGYHWFIEGEVVHGDRRGRELGYPTANITTPSGFHLAQGVYAVRARLGDRLIGGVAGYGKPMFGNVRPPFETFLFEFDEDIYGQILEVALVGHIRGQEVFPDLPALITAMDRDCERARAILATAVPITELDRRLGFFA